MLGQDSVAAEEAISEERRRLLTGFLFILWGANDLPGGLSELTQQILRHGPIREARYSPTTMYKDYAISPVLFHQTSSRAAVVNVDARSHAPPWNLSQAPSGLDI